MNWVPSNALKSLDEKQIGPGGAWPEALSADVVVAHTGFEPVISALRGRRPRPLDECAMFYGKGCRSPGIVPYSSRACQGFVARHIAYASEFIILSRSCLFRKGKDARRCTIPPLKA